MAGTMPGNAGSWRLLICVAITPLLFLQWAAAEDLPDLNQQPPSTPQSTSTAQPTSPAQPFAIDSDTVAAGQAAFLRSCTSCHDEQRSLQKAKSYSGWLSTVQRMASKTGADISSADVAPIAAYLSSVAGGVGGAAVGGDADSG